MPAGIDTITCSIVRTHELGALKETVEIWRYPGADGYGAQLTGLGDAAFRFTLIQYGLPADVASWIAAIEQKQGTVVTITDAWGVVHEHMLVTKVTAAPMKAERGNGGCRGQIEIDGVRIE